MSDSLKVRRRVSDELKVRHGFEIVTDRSAIIQIGWVVARKDVGIWFHPSDHEIGRQVFHYDANGEYVYARPIPDFAEPAPPKPTPTFDGFYVAGWADLSYQPREGEFLLEYGYLVGATNLEMTDEFLAGYESANGPIYRRIETERGAA